MEERQRMQQRDAVYDDRDLWDKIWRNEDGDIVIWQWPNAWLIGWAVVTLISLVVTGKVSDVFFWIGVGLLLVWSALEILKGVNYFRRALGVVVLLMEIMMIINVLK